MIAKIKLYLILGAIVVTIGLFVAKYLNNHSFVSNEFIESKDKLIAESEKKIISLDSTVFSITQDLDICQANDTKLKIVIAEQKKQLNKTLFSENSCCAEVLHLEKTGMIKHDTVYLNILGNVPKRYKK